MNRSRWVEALERLPEGPQRELLRTIGQTLTSPSQAGMVSLASRTDALVEHILAEPEALPVR